MRAVVSACSVVANAPAGRAMRAAVGWNAGRNARLFFPAGRIIELRTPRYNGWAVAISWLPPPPPPYLSFSVYFSPTFARLSAQENETNDGVDVLAF